jgi:predicted molibdopterin-dependent oxidoreductase YjgC
VYRGQADVFSISTVDETFHNKGFLCVKGRFGYRYMLEPERLTKPMIKKKGQHQEVTWEEAFEFAAKKLKGIIDKDGAEAVAAFGSPRMTNEELYLLQKFVRAGLKTDNIGSFTNLINGVEQNALDDMFGITTSTATLDDLKKADVIMVLNADMQEQNLVAEMRVKRAQKEAGVKLITVSSSELELNKFADLSIDSKRGTNTALLNGLAKMFIDKGLANKDFIGKRTEGFDAFAASLANFDIDRVSEITGVGKDKLEHLSALLSQPDLNLMVVYNIDALWEKSKNDLKAIGNLLMLNGKIGQPGNGIVVLRDFSNAQGILDMGVDPAYLPGNVKVGDSKAAAKLAKLWGTELTLKPVDLKAQLENDQIKGLIIFGEDPLRTTSNLRLTGGAEFTLVVDSFMTPTAIEADVVLPAALPVETKGSYTACDRRVQTFDRVFSPKTGMDNWQIIAKLAEKLGVNLGVTSVEDIGNEINKANAYYSKAKPFWGNGLFAEKFPTSSGKGKFAVLPLDVSPLSLDKKAYLASEQFIETKIKARLSL